MANASDLPSVGVERGRGEGIVSVIGEAWPVAGIGPIGLEIAEVQPHAEGALPALISLEPAGLDHLRKRLAWHDRFHRLEKLVAPRRLAAALEHSLPISRHGKGLLRHLQITHRRPCWWTSISIAPQVHHQLTARLLEP